jgi:hypothetical protein
MQILDKVELIKVKQYDNNETEFNICYRNKMNGQWYRDYNGTLERVPFGTEEADELESEYQKCKS